MPKRHPQRLVFRFIIALVFAAAFVAAPSNSARPRAAVAIPVPCTFCETMFNNCTANCGTLGNTWACLNQCANRYNTCITDCS